MKKNLKKMIEKLAGTKIKIISKTHPHYNREGTIDGFDHTPAGWGIKVKFNEDESCYVFKSEDAEIG